MLVLPDEKGALVDLLPCGQLSGMIPREGDGRERGAGEGLLVLLDEEGALVDLLPCGQLSGMIPT